MNVMLAGAGVTLALEPFCLFILKLGMTGSALAGIAGRMAFASVGLVGVFLIHRMYTRPERTGLMRDIRAILATAIPAVATNVATPFANLYTTAALAAVDDAAIAAWTVIARLTPVAFGAVFCLTGAVGPVIGQNLGARAADRVHATFTAALKTNTVFCVVACVALALLSPALPGWFGLAGRAAEIVRFYCLYVAPLWLFLGYLFVANAVFNTLGRAHFATALNWGRATLGTIPLVWLGGRLAGAEGIVFASMAGAIVVGLLSVWLARRTLPVVA
jgi:Na+-driven multidrug efflux pump